MRKARVCQRELNSREKPESFHEDRRDSRRFVQGRELRLQIVNPDVEQRTPQHYAKKKEKSPDSLEPPAARRFCSWPELCVKAQSPGTEEFFCCERTKFEKCRESWAAVPQAESEQAERGEEKRGRSFSSSGFKETADTEDEEEEEEEEEEEG